ncbi:MAG: hypothetical protein ACK4N5_25110, partial [Myxococcales bacterium]
GWRDTFGLRGRARLLTGAPHGEKLLVVGGTGAVPLYPLIDSPSSTGTRVIPPSMIFVERLRGFEDLALFGNGVVSVGGDYRLPFIIDRGTASTLGVLPSMFLSQIDLQLFGTAATTLQTDLRAAVGGAASLRFSFWNLPLSLNWQVARRLTDDRSVVQLVTIDVQ